MDTYDYIAAETERQSGTAREALGMYDALLHAQSVNAITENILIDWVESINGQNYYRRTPVFFRNGGHAANHENIPRLMKNLVEAINDQTIDFMDYRETYSVGFSRADVLTKEFLEIHPFSDGNGRVGSLLWNFLNDTITDPVVMPYFFGDS